jgi:hypothetical protein
VTEPAAQQIPSPTTPGTVTLIEGTTVCVCIPSGDILPTSAGVRQAAGLIERGSDSGNPRHCRTILCDDKGQFDGNREGR